MLLNPTSYHYQLAHTYPHFISSPPALNQLFPMHYLHTFPQHFPHRPYRLLLSKQGHSARLAVLQQALASLLPLPPVAPTAPAAMPTPAMEPAATAQPGEPAGEGPTQPPHLPRHLAQGGGEGLTPAASEGGALPPADGGTPLPLPPQPPPAAAAAAAVALPRVQGLPAVSPPLLPRAPPQVSAALQGSPALSPLLSPQHCQALWVTACQQVMSERAAGERRCGSRPVSKSSPSPSITPPPLPPPFPQRCACSWS